MRAPKPTPTELQTWRSLAAAAEAAAARPTQAGAQALGKLAKEARRAVTPIQPPSRDNLFVRLVVIALRFAGETTAGRAALAGELAAIAAAAKARPELNPEPAGAPATRLPYAEG